MALIVGTKDNFKKEVLDKKGVVFVDFYAAWCGPCKFTSPIIEDLAESDQYKHKVSFVKVDVDANQELASQYNIFSIPTFIIFKDSAPIAQLVGARDRGGFENELDKIL